MKTTAYSITVTERESGRMVRRSVVKTRTIAERVLTQIRGEYPKPVYLIVYEIRKGAEQ
jgi:hypothetical protein